MNLKLTRPLSFFDLETTGLNIATDRIVEISILKIQPNGNKDSFTKRINPTIPIPLESSEIHGIYDYDVKDEPTIKELAAEISEFIKGCDLAGYNSNRFDIPLLAEEMLRSNVDLDIKSRKLIDVQEIFHKKEKRTLEAAFTFYCNKDLKDAHSAAADTNATFEVLDAQIAKYDDIEGEIDFLSEFTTGNRRTVDFAGRIILNDNDIPVFNFGKYKGRTVTEVLLENPGYYGWILQAEFPLYTKKVLTDIKNNM